MWCDSAPQKKKKLMGRQIKMECQVKGRCGKINLREDQKEV